MERVFVVGAMMRGEALNGKLISLGGRFCIESYTVAEYRMFLLEDRIPVSCGMARTKGGGISIRGEVWKLPLESWGDFVAYLMVEPECVAWVALAEEVGGGRCLALVVDATRVEGLVDITEQSQGSWHAYRERKTGVTMTSPTLTTSSPPPLATPDVFVTDVSDSSFFSVKIGFAGTDGLSESTGSAGSPPGTPVESSPSKKRPSVVASGPAPPETPNEVVTDALIEHWDALPAERRLRLLCREVPAPLVGKLWFSLSHAMRYRQAGQFEASANKPPAPNVESFIKRDVLRTFSEKTFSPAQVKQLRKKLFLVLKAYSNYEPSVGYAQQMQGMNFLGATLLQYMGVEETFWTLVAMMQRDGPYRLRGMFKRKSAHLPVALYCLKSLIGMFLPRLAEHLEKIRVSPVMFGTSWVVTVFSYGAALEFTTRCWHLFFELGKVAIFRIALGILKCYEAQVLTMGFEEAVAFLSAPQKSELAPRVLEEAVRFVKIDEALLKRLKKIAADLIRSGTLSDSMI